MPTWGLTRRQSAKLALSFATRCTMHHRMLPIALAPLGAIAASAALFCGAGDRVLAQEETPSPASERVVIRADVQEYDAATGTFVARGNVEIDYPARQVRAYAVQAQIFQQEDRMVLSGDVLVLQEENRIQAETVVYLIDEDRFIATPKSQQQVETVYTVPAQPEAPAEDGPT